MLEEILEGRSSISTHELIDEVGARIDDDRSLLHWCHRRGVKVFVPGITDGSFGSQLWMVYQNKRDLRIDPFADVAHVREWPEKERLKGEKDTLGLYLTGHPFDEYEQEVRRFVRSAIADIQPSRSPQRVAGLIVAHRTMKTRTGSTMCFVTLDDRSGRIEATLFAEAFNENRELLQSDQVIVLEGQVSHDDYSGQMKMRVSSVMDVATARQSFSRGLQLKLEAEQLQNGLLDRLDDTLRPFRSQGSPVWIEYVRDNARTRIELGESWRVQPDDKLLHELRYLVGDNRVELVYD